MIDMFDHIDLPRGSTAIDVGGLTRWGKWIRPPMESQNDGEALRVVLFGSAYRGTSVLKELIKFRGAVQGVAITGLCTDAVTGGGRISAKRRLWQYMDRDRVRLMESTLGELALNNGIPVFTGGVKSPFFQQQILEQWKPDVIIMSTFGQLVPPEVFRIPRYGTYNLHPSDLSRGEYPGPNPFQEMMDAGATITRVAMHHVDGQFDTGEVIGVSPEICVLTDTPGVRPTVERLHHQTSPAAGKMASALVKQLLSDRARVETLNLEGVFDEAFERQLLLKASTANVKDGGILQLVA